MSSLISMEELFVGMDVINRMKARYGFSLANE
jgi:hypothetical protein